MGETRATTKELEERVLQLEGRLRVLEDIEAIRRLKARYAELVDARYADGAPKQGAELERLAGEIAALFTEDAIWNGGGGPWRVPGTGADHPTVPQAHAPLLVALLREAADRSDG